MCSEEKLQLAKENKAFVFRKKSFYITTSITLGIIFAGVIVSFTTVKLKASELDKRLCKVEKQVVPIKEIYFNLQYLFRENDWIWVDDLEK